MLIVCFAAKHGQGCSTVTALIGLDSQDARPILVDATGDLHAVLGCIRAEQAGLSEALAERRSLEEVRHDLIHDTRVDVLCQGFGSLNDFTPDQWRQFGDVLATDKLTWIVDAGCGPARAMTDVATESFLVTRYCFLALKDAAQLGASPTGIITVREPGRMLDIYDFERVLDAPVLAEIQWVPEICRAVDAGLLSDEGIPQAAQKGLRPITADTAPAKGGQLS